MAALMICAGILPAACGQASAPAKAMEVPSLPFYDWGATPGEGSAYNTWTAHRPATVYDTWKEGRVAIAQLMAGDKATGVTGVIVTYKPGLIRMDRDLPEQDLRRGDTILTYTDRGEGFSAVWFKGRYHAEFDISFAKLPDGSGCGGAHCAAAYVDLGKKTWWVQVKLASGAMGWVDLNLTQAPMALY